MLEKQQLQTFTWIFPCMYMCSHVHVHVHACTHTMYFYVLTCTFTCMGSVYMYTCTWCMRWLHYIYGYTDQCVSHSFDVFRLLSLILSRVFISCRASGTVHTAMEVATGQQVNLLLPPPPTTTPHTHFTPFSFTLLQLPLLVLTIVSMGNLTFQLLLFTSYSLYNYF